MFIIIDMVEVGPKLHAVGVTSDMLLSPHLSELSAINLSKVTNGLILELHSFMNKNLNCTYYTLLNWVTVLLGEKWPKDHPPTVKALRQSVVWLSARLSKYPNSEVKVVLIARFLDDEYCLPKIFMYRGSYDC